jgi:hemerythrin-like domain-containing protein
MIGKTEYQFSLEKFILTPWKCSDRTVQKCIFVALSVFTLVLTLGTIHICFALRRVFLVKTDDSVIKDIDIQPNNGKKDLDAGSVLSSTKENIEIKGISNITHKLKNQENEYTFFSKNLWKVFTTDYLYTYSLKYNKGNKNKYYSDFKDELEQLLELQKKVDDKILEALIKFLQDSITAFDGLNKDTSETEIYFDNSNNPQGIDMNPLYYLDNEFGEMKSMIKLLKEVVTGVRGEDDTTTEIVAKKGFKCLNYFHHITGREEFKKGKMGSYYEFFNILKIVINYPERPEFDERVFSLDENDKSETVVVVCPCQITSNHVGALFYQKQKVFLFDNMESNVMQNPEEATKKEGDILQIYVTKKFFDESAEFNKIDFSTWKSLNWSSNNCYISTAFLMYAMYDFLNKKNGSWIGLYGV